jgi:hypothetical protein
MSLLLSALLSLSAADAATPAGKYFTITVVDEQTGRGVPLVELKTTNDIRYYTDSNGVVAFYEPGLMGRSVFFHVRSHGYEFPKDGFGYRGKALNVAEGGSATLKIKRVNIAERLYRVTGGGIYRDSLLVGRPVPLRQPVLNAQVLGQDSVVNAVYHGKYYWFWGDTNRPGYPLGNFQVPGATSALPGGGARRGSPDPAETPDRRSLDPATGVNLDYFVDAKGFAKETCRMPGEGPTWISGPCVVRDASGRERMFAHYVKVRGQLEVYAQGIAEFNDDKKQFEPVVTFAKGATFETGGQPFRYRADGVDYFYFAVPFPLIRVPATAESVCRSEDYEAYTCLKPGTSKNAPQLDRDADGRLRWAWKKNAPLLDHRTQTKLLAAKQLRPDEVRFQLRDADTGKHIFAHRGSVNWNAYRRRWVMIAVEQFGTSPLGEIWYAEADAPLGPWSDARKIVTHDRYSFYNPKQHPIFDQDDGRIIYFEGTYTNSFSGNPEQTPRYDYNQIMYRLDLSDPRLRLPPRR